MRKRVSAHWEQDWLDSWCGWFFFPSVHLNLSVPSNVTCIHVPTSCVVSVHPAHSLMTPFLPQPRHWIIQIVYCLTVIDIPPAKWSLNTREACEMQLRYGIIHAGAYDPIKNVCVLTHFLSLYPVLSTSEKQKYVERGRKFVWATHVPGNCAGVTDKTQQWVNECFISRFKHS